MKGARVSAAIAMLLMFLLTSGVWGTSINYVPDEIIIEIDPEHIAYPALSKAVPIGPQLWISADLRTRFEKIGVSIIERVFYNLVPSESILRNRLDNTPIPTANLLNFYKLKTSRAADIEEAVADLRRAEGVVSVSPNYLMQPSSCGDTPDDPYRCSPFGSHPRQWYLEKIEMEDVWINQGVKGENGDIVIGVVEPEGLYPHNDVDDNITDSGDYYGGHGLMVTAILGADTDNAQGISGASYNAAVVVGETDSSFSASDVAWCMFFTGADSDVLNYSFHGGETAFMDSVIEVLYDAGRVQVASAGNDAANLDNYSYPYRRFPCQHARVICVAACDSTDALWASSAYGTSSIDIVAPGVAMLTAFAFNSYWGIGINGTSYAAPLVTATAALMLTKNDGRNPDQIRSAIVASGDTIESGAYLRLNAKNAVSQTPSPKIVNRQALVTSRKYGLYPNQPNPFNPQTTISFSLPENDFTSLEILSMLGQHVRTLVSRRMDAGTHSVSWDGCNDKGEPMAAGVYIYKLQSGRLAESRKMLLLW